jgi:hypothetical protein
MVPGNKTYDPCRPWLAKTRAEGRIACDLFTCVDDERVTGPEEELTWQVSHVLASKQSYLGIQDAGTRKVGPSSKMPGAWAGAIMHVLPKLGVYVLTSNEKWTKMKGILGKWWNRVTTQESPRLNHKELLLDQRFLVYVTRTYPAMIPYLKGFHLTIEMWRGGRDSDGWRVRDNLSVGSIKIDQAEDKDVAGASRKGRKHAGWGNKYAPDNGMTTLVPRSKDDLAALMALSFFELPHLRPSQVVQVFYGFGDASGKQFGATISKITTAGLGSRRLQR